MYQSKIVTFDLLGGLGNQLFQIFATLAYGIRTNTKVMFPYKVFFAILAQFITLIKFSKGAVQLLIVLENSDLFTLTISSLHLDKILLLVIITIQMMPMIGY